MKTLNIVNIVTVASLNKTVILWQETDTDLQNPTTAENWIEDGILSRDAVLELAKTRVSAGMEAVIAPICATATL